MWRTPGPVCLLAYHKNEVQACFVCRHAIDQTANVGIAENRVRFVPTWLLIAGVSAVLVLWHLAYVWRADRNYRGPYLDEFVVTELVAGVDPHPVSSLFASHYGHRLVVPKLALVAAARLSGGFRLGRYLCVAAMALAALGFLCAASRLRGYFIAQDAVIPLLLMPIGGFFSTIHSFDLHFLIPLAILGAAVALLSHRDTQPSSIRVTLLVSLIATLMLCGVNGIVMGLSLAAPTYFALRTRLSARRRVLTVVVGGGGVLALGVAMIPWGAIPTGHAANPQGYLLTALQFLAVGWGAGFKDTWPVWALLSLFVIATAVALLFGDARNGPTARRRLFLLGPLFGHLAIAVSVAAARSAWGDDPRAGYALRYTQLAAPGLALAYLALAGRERKHRFRVLAWVMLLALVATVPTYAQKAMKFQARFLALTDGFLADVRSGEPLPTVFGRHGRSFYPYSNDAAERWFPLLYAHRFGPFDRCGGNAPPAR